MTILDKNTIDMVATRPDSQIVKLVIADHLAWDEIDVEEHLRMIQDKINTCIAFVESGQLLRLTEPRIPPSPDIRITLHGKYPPVKEATEFFMRADAFLRTVGLQFEFELRP